MSSGIYIQVTFETEAEGRWGRAEITFSLAQLGQSFQDPQIDLLLETHIS